MTNALAKLDKATQMLAEAKNLDEVKHVHDLAKAAVTYAKAAKLGLKAENHAKGIQLLAAHKSGEFLKQLERGKPSPGSTISNVGNGSEYAEALEDAGISYQDANRFMAIADVPEEAWLLTKKKAMIE